jgi:hypothetical protein
MVNYERSEVLFGVPTAVACANKTYHQDTNGGGVVKYPNSKKGVIRSRKSKDRQHNGQTNKDKQWSTNHFIEN